MCIRDRASLGLLGANLGPIWANLDQLGPTWANLGPTWCQLGPTWANMEPTWGQLGAHLGPAWANLGQLGPIWNQLQPAWANISQRRLTWGQLEAHTNVKIIEKPLVFLGFSNIVKKSLESFGKALGLPWEALGMPWGHSWGRPALEDLGKAWKDPPRIHVRAAPATPAKALSPISL